MSLQDSVDAAVRGFVDRVRRDALAYAICGVCALAALVLATSAGVLALVPLVGTINALLIAAGVFVVIMGGIVAWVQRAPAKQPVTAFSAPPETAVRQAQFAQIAMIIEAVMLGYSLSRRR